jgi:serine protease AprX
VECMSTALLERAERYPNVVFSVGIELAGTPVQGPDLEAAIAALKVNVVGRSIVRGTEYLFAQVSGSDLVRLADQPQPGIVAYIHEERTDFDRENLANTSITQPLLGRIIGHPEREFQLIIDINQDARIGREGAIERVRTLIADAGGDVSRIRRRADATHPYIFVTLRGRQVQVLARLDRERAEAQLKEDRARDDGLRRARSVGASPVITEDQPTIGRQSSPLAPYLAIYKIWEDAVVHPLVTRTISTVKADAAQISFSALGAHIVWAVIDSGIDGDHVHFKRHGNLNPPSPLTHEDFTPNGTSASALIDSDGHGTHVAGIIAGELRNEDAQRLLNRQAQLVSRVRRDDGTISFVGTPVSRISGMAPECKLLSYKVVPERGPAQVSYVIDAIEKVQRVNDYGRRLLIHGVNLSLGYSFEPEWFACGQSPLCVEVNRLVRSGVVVVVAAGNSGYASFQLVGGQAAPPSGVAQSIADPGNAELAITVGSTHRDMPHTYGVSYFSSKGPTGDGRDKPDLVAPGEKIVSCAAGRNKAKLVATSRMGDQFDYMEDTGTSMAAPHVSGLIAAFLSVRGEFRGDPLRVKKVFVQSSTDLGRTPTFQGAGLVDLMRAIQSV